MNKSGQTEDKSTTKRKFLFIPLKRLLPYLGLIVGILMIIFQQSLWTYTEGIVGRLLIDIIRIETRDQYTISYEKVRFNIFKDQLRLTKFSVIEEINDSTDSPDSIQTFALRSSLLSLNVESFLDVLIRREINIEGLELTRPYIRIVDKNENNELDSLEAKSGKVFNLVGNYLDNFRISELKVTNAAIEYVKVLPDSMYSVKVSDISFLVKSFNIENPLNDAQQSISTSHFEFEILKDTINIFPGHLVSFSKIRGSSLDSIFRIENLRVSPIGTVGQELHLDMLLPFVQLSGFHPREVIFNDTLRSKSFQIGAGRVHLNMSKLKIDSGSTFKYELPTIILENIKTQKIDLLVTYPSGEANHIIDIKKLELATSRIKFDVNSFENYEESFKSLDLNIKAREYSVNFAIPGHLLSSKNIILDIKRGYFSTDDFMIVPESFRGSQYKTNISNVQIWGLNFPEALFNQNLQARKILIRRLNQDIIIGSDSQDTKKVDFNNIYPIVSSIFPSVKILDLHIRDSNLTFKNLAANTEIRFDDYSIRFNDILIDTSLVRNPKQILGAESMALQGSSMNLISKSGIKEINSGPFYLNTLNEQIQISDVKYTSHYPSFQEIACDQVSVTQLKFFELIHNRTLRMDSLILKKMRISINDLDSIYIPTDSLIYSSTPEFLDSLNVQHIAITDGEIDIQGSKDTRLHIEEFKGIIDNVNVVKKFDKLYWQSYQFYGENGPFSLAFNEVNHMISGKSMIISKSDSTLRINQLVIAPVKRSNSNNLVDITVPNLLLTGIDITHLLDSNLITTKKTIFINPGADIKYRGSSAHSSDSGTSENTKKKSGLRFLANEVSVINGTFRAVYNTDSATTNYARADWVDISIKKFQFTPETILNTDLKFIDHLDLVAKGVSHSRIAQVDTIYFDKLQLNSDDYLYGENIHAQGSNDNISIDATIPSLRLSSSKWLSKILTNDLNLDSLLISNPKLAVSITTDKLTNSEYPDNPAFSLMQIRVDSGSMQLTYNDMFYNVPEFDLDIDHFDLTGKYSDLYSRDFSLNIKGLKDLLPDSYSIVNIAEVDFSTGKKTLRFIDLEIDPKYSKLDYGRVLGYQTDWINVRAGTFSLSGIDFPNIIENGSLYLTDAQIDSVYIMIYRDKNIPFPETQVRYMPHRMISNIEFPITIESFVANNTNIIYEELTEEADSAGFVEFTNLTAGISNITNDSIRLRTRPNLQIAANSVFMGAGNLHADLEFDLTDPEGKHNYSAYLSQMPLVNLNMILEPNVNVRIRSGTLNSMNMSVEGNRDYCIGTMRFLYNDLHFNLIGKKKGTTSSMGPAMGSFFANAFIVNRNNPKLVLVRNGDIFFERDTTKSVINYITKSTLSGVVSSIGARNNRKYIKKVNAEARQNQELKRKRERIDKDLAMTSKQDLEN